MNFSRINALCYRTKMTSRLSRSLSHFDKNVLLDDISDALFYFNERQEIIESFSSSYRIKSMNSVLMKYDRYDKRTSVERVYNDLLGFRYICKDYDKLDILEDTSIRRISDMRYGKNIDDGYRGIHIYIQPSHEHYPIEIQINTLHDRIFADWAHIYLYKQADVSVGARLRKLYDEGIIKNEDDFQKEIVSCVI